MAILIKRHDIPDGSEPTITGMLGVSQGRKGQLEYLVKTICDRRSGTFFDDFQILAREVESNEEFAFCIFQYGVIIGTNMAIQAAAAQIPKN